MTMKLLQFASMSSWKLHRHVEEPETNVPFKRVVEDVKSKATKTSQYQMKRKMLQERFGVEVQEV